jgi:radical SAM superfamily enzyme YgiQ (UPF0313 family)
MKFLLVNAPYLDVYGSLNVGRNFSFPLGLGYIAAVLRKAGHKVGLLDPEPQRLDLEGVREVLRRERPDVVGISCATANFKNALKIAGVVKDNIGSVVVLGGVHASALPLEIMENFPQFDFLVIGEGEETIVELADFLQTGRRQLNDIRGIAYRRDGQIRLNLPRPFMSKSKLEQLPHPARDLVDLNNYRPQVHLDRGRKAASMISSRGCPARCTFCASYLTNGFAFRGRSPQRVLAEIEDLVYNYQVRHIIFVDDTFTFDKERVVEICQLILQRGLKIDWHCFARVDRVSEEMLSFMKKAGCFSLLFGVESADEGVLRNIRKGITLKQARQALRIANRLGFKTLVSFIFGNPGDTPQTLKRTIDFAIRLRPTIASFNILVPYPGTEVFRLNYQNKFRDPNSWDTFLPKAVNPISRTAALSPQDLRRWTAWAFSRFYLLRPWQVLRMLMAVRTVGELKSYIRGSLGLCRRLKEWYNIKRE